MAAALRGLHEALGATTTTIYLLTSDGRRLSAAMAVDNPVAFTVVPGMEVDDLRYCAASAYQSGEVEVWEEADVQRVISEDPATLFKAPFPMVLASAPLQTSVRRLGVVTLRWASPHPISTDVLRRLASTADVLAAELDVLVERGLPMVAPRVPVFISPTPLTAPRQSANALASPQALDLNGPALAGSTFLYQLVQLVSELTAAVRPPEVLSACWEQMVCPFGGDAVMLSLAESGRLRIMGAAGLSREAVRSVDGLPLTRPHPATDCMARIEPLSYASTRDLQADYPGLVLGDDDRAWVFLPLIADGRAAGCCALGFPLSISLRPLEQALLLIMLEHVAQSLVRARSYDIEHAVAEELQRGLLPGSLPHLVEVEIAARYLSATTGSAIGGDWYDVVSLPGRGLGLVVGDVEGHSLEAAAIMGQLRSAVCAYAAEGHDPATLLTRSNRLLADLGTDLFATCCCVWLDLDTGSMLMASAGHPLPLVADREDSVVAEQVLSVGPPLGVEPDTVYQQAEMDLPPGGLVVVYSNGLPATRSAGSDIEGWLRKSLAEDQCQNLELLADRLTGSDELAADREDDAALLLVRYRGGQPAVRGHVARIWVERHDLHGVAQVRRALRSFLREWNRDAFLDDLELLASEVVTNALIHAQSDVDVRLREYPDRIRMEVRDSDPHPPVPVVILNTDEDELRQAESGRGLLIVEAVASAWGSSPVGPGKVTWFEVGTAA